MYEFAIREKQVILQEGQTFCQYCKGAINMTEEVSYHVHSACQSLVDQYQSEKSNRIAYQIREWLEFPMNYSDLFKALGIGQPKGILLHGPPGTLTNKLAKIIANGIAKVTNSSVVPVSGSTFRRSLLDNKSLIKLRGMLKQSEHHPPAIIVIDDLQFIMPKFFSPLNDILVSQIFHHFLAFVDGLDEKNPIKIIGTTSDLGLVHSTIMRPTRLERVIEIPTYDLSFQLMEYFSNIDSTPLTPSFDFLA